MSYTDEIDSYRHPFWRGAIGLEKDSKNPSFSCDNYHLITAHHHHRLFSLGLIPMPEEVENVREFILACQERPGLFLRFPGRIDDISQDEMVGIAWLSWRYGWGFAQQMLSWGDSHYWIFDAAHPERLELTYWYGRHLYLAPFIDACAGNNLVLHEQFLWRQCALASPRSEYPNSSGKLFMYLQMPVMWSKSWLTHPIVKATVRTWVSESEMQGKYPGGPCELFSVWFPKAHPLARYGPKTFREGLTRPKTPIKQP